MIYFDNAATGFPKPKQIVREVSNAMFKCGNSGRSGHKYSIFSSEILYSAREELANLYGTNPENVILTTSATYALNIAIKGLCKKNSKILISDVEHNSVIRPSNASGEILVFDVDIENDLKTVENFTKKILENLKKDSVNNSSNNISGKTLNEISLVVITHASNVCGRVLPVEEIASICNQYNIPIIIDASQTAGYVKINLNESNIDVVCIPGHKGLYGPMGTGALIINPNKNLFFNTLIQGGTGIMSSDVEMPYNLPERLEAGTLGVHDFAGLALAVKRCNFNENEYQKLFFYLIEELEKIENITLYGISKSNLEKYMPVISFNCNFLKSEEFSNRLISRGICVRSGFHCSPMTHQKLNTGENGTVRISLGKNNTYKECKKAIDIIKEVTKA